MSRPILATFYHKNEQKNARRYARIDTALPKAVYRLILEGEPGDVIEFSHAEWGFQIGTAKIKVGGNIILNWTEEK